MRFAVIEEVFSQAEPSVLTTVSQAGGAVRAASAALAPVAKGICKVFPKMKFCKKKPPKRPQAPPPPPPSPAPTQAGIGLGPIAIGAGAIIGGLLLFGMMRR